MLFELASSDSLSLWLSLSLSSLSRSLSTKGRDSGKTPPPPSPKRGGREVVWRVLVPARSLETIADLRKVTGTGPAGAAGWRVSRGSTRPARCHCRLGADRCQRTTPPGQQEGGPHPAPTHRAFMPHAVWKVGVLEPYLGHFVLVAARGTTSTPGPQHSSRQLEIQRRVPSASTTAAATDSWRRPGLSKESHSADPQPDPSRRRRLRGPGWGGSRSHGVQVLLKGGAPASAVGQHDSHAEPEALQSHSRPPPPLIPGTRRAAGGRSVSFPPSQQRH